MLLLVTKAGGSWEQVEVRELCILIKSFRRRKERERRAREEEGGIEVGKSQNPSFI